MLNPIVAALLRGVRSLVAMGLPILISYLSGNPDVRWAALAPVIMAIAKYLRDTYKWEWLPV
jgi:hypothetical protein